MYCIIDMCCLCLSYSYESSKGLKEMDDDQITFYEKLILTFPQMKIKQPYDDFRLCMKCIDIINTIYKFSKMILRNKRTYLKYRKKLSKIENRKGDFFVTIRDCFEDKKFIGGNRYNIHELDFWDNPYMYNNTIKNEGEVKKEVIEMKIKHTNQSDIITAQEIVNHVQYERSKSLSIQKESPIAVNYKQHSPMEEETSISSKEDVHWCHNCNTEFRNSTREEMHRCKFTNFSLYFEDSDDSQEELVPKKLKTKSVPVQQVTKTNPSKKRHSCNICKKEFSSKTAVKVHIQGVHRKEKEYTCYFCEKIFFLKHHVLRHLKAVHGAGKLYFCDICNKKFALQRDLFKHSLVHAGKCVSCKFCGKKFKKKQNLLSHNSYRCKDKLHHCDTCGKRYKYKASLIVHERLHTQE